MKLKLVYFDDDVRNIECFQLMLRDRFDVIGCQNVGEYSKILKEHNPHAFLLDVHMPEMDGHHLCKKITTNPSYNDCPVLFISGDVSDKTQLQSHSKGGLDFLTRDMDVAEIEMRLINKIKLFLTSANKLSAGNLTLDFMNFKVFVNDRDIDLTLVEMRIISSLLRSIPESLTRLELYRKIWGEASEVKLPTLNTHITNFMSKLNGWNHTIQIRNESILLIPKD